MLIVAVFSAGRLAVSRAWARPTPVDVDVTHALMGVATAGMLVPALDPLGDRVWEVVFAAIAVWFLWKCQRFISKRASDGRDGDHAHHVSHSLTHLVMALAMVYMYLVPTSSGNGSQTAGVAMAVATGPAADFVGLPLLFLAVLFASGIWELDGISRFSSDGSVPQPIPALAPAANGGPAADHGTPSPFVGATRGGVESSTVGHRLAPKLEACCHIAMCTTMGYMLITML